MKKLVRVRFAPSPTGAMHIGNVRTALFNYVFARQHAGVFVLRIEDTDAQRNVSQGVESILADLSWLGIVPDEGVGSHHNEACRQSDRTEIYLRVLAQLVEQKRVYKCFCTKERLEIIRREQIAAGLPPRYDGHCRTLIESCEKKIHAQGTPFVWRFKRDVNAQIRVNTLERGEMAFEMEHFYDFPLTRSDESFTFLFTNAVDDIEMGITHVIRGQDHLSNTALQAALYQTLGASLPTFVHLPLLVDTQGKKLSKRAAGFSLDEVRGAGILPNALIHYLLTLGGTTITTALSTAELMKISIIDRLKGAHITYDINALHAVNKLYLQELSDKGLFVLMHDKHGSKLKAYDDHLVMAALMRLRKEARNVSHLETLIIQVVAEPNLKKIDTVDDVLDMLRIFTYAQNCVQKNDDMVQVLTVLKEWARAEGVPIKKLFSVVRYALTGVFSGIAVGDLFAILPQAVLRKRLEHARRLYS